MKKNLRSKILLCVLAGGVLAANTALAAEYTETITGANDSYGTGVKSSDGNGSYTYNFNDGDSIVLTNPNSNSLTGISNSAGSITINGNITLSVTSTDSNQAYATAINNSKQLTIGDITIIAQANAEENGTANVKSEGIYGVLPGSLNKIPYCL